MVESDQLPSAAALHGWCVIGLQIYVISVRSAPLAQLFGVRDSQMRTETPPHLRDRHRDRRRVRIEKENNVFLALLKQLTQLVILPSVGVIPC
jgi:hypothetical protein